MRMVCSRVRSSGQAIAAKQAAHHGLAMDYPASLRRWGFCRGGWREQGGGLEQATELLFAAAVMGAFACLEVLHHFVSHFETGELDDPDEFVLPLPDLALLQF